MCIWAHRDSGSRHRACLHGSESGGVLEVKISTYPDCFPVWSLFIYFSFIYLLISLYLGFTFLIVFLTLTNWKGERTCLQIGKSVVVRRTTCVGFYFPKKRLVSSRIAMLPNHNPKKKQNKIKQNTKTNQHNNRKPLHASCALLPVVCSASALEMT